MGAWKLVRVGGLAWALALLAAQGCGNYLQHRAADAAGMADFGITVTETPYLSFYGCGLDVMTFGAGHVDGYLIGVGGNQVGVIRHYEKTLGLVLWGYEELGWGDNFDVNRQETLFSHNVALLGWLTDASRRPAYGPA